MAIGPRDVVRIWDRHTRPNKDKLNSNPIFPPVHPILAVNNPFLHHDSYVELQQLVRHLAYEIARAEHIGTISEQEARGLVAAVRKAETLSEEHKQLIEARLLRGDYG